MSGYEDAEHAPRHKAPYSSKHPIPTIQKFREEKEARREEAEAREHDEAGAAQQLHPTDEGEASGQQNGEQQQDAGAHSRDFQTADDDDGRGPAIDTSEADASATDPKARRKELKKRKDERAERVVTDPVTHLPVTIHDLSSDALKEVAENDEPFGLTSKTATGLSNKTKSAKQLQSEGKEMQSGYESMRALFPPPKFDEIKQELQHIYKVGVTAALVGIAVVVVLMTGVERLIRYEILYKDNERPRALIVFSIWIWPAVIMFATIFVLIYGVRAFMLQRIESMWDDEVWEAKRQQANIYKKGSETETVKWLNSLLASVWPLVNPDLFTSLADTLEDVMQASLPRMVQMVSVNDIGQGSESIRILGIRWLPTGAAARSVTEDGKLKDPQDSSNHANDRQVPGQGTVEEDAGGNEKSGKQTQQAEDGSQQQVSEGMEAEEGDFVNMEIAFAYRARSNKRTMKDRAKDMHLYIAFYLPGNIKIPVWVDLRGVVGTMRMRLQLCPDPPFFSLCTLTFLGQPKVDLSCTPLSRHAVNIMDVPLISNFVQSAVDAAMAEYVAPKSLNLDLKDMLSGDDFKKDTNARGVLVVNIKRGYDFKEGDVGIPLLREGSSDPYVSVGWAKFGKPVWSTRLLLKEMEPWWDESAYVLVTPEELNVSERLRLQLWDSDRLTADDDLGRIEVDIKEIMKNPESDGKMWTRADGFRALEAGQSMPGKLEWSVGYFSKTEIQYCQLQEQTFDPAIRNIDQMKQRVQEISERKLREASVKEGRHKHDADELEQQRAQELKSMQDSMIISAPPPDGYPSGIFSIQIHQITGLELEAVNKKESDKAAEGNDEEEEGEGLPSAYCSLIINHSKVFKTRTKPKNAKPFYNAGTEFIADWRNTEVYVAVRDARVKEDDALLGIVHLPLHEVFKERSQINGFYPLTGGIGYGRIRISMVWRSVQLQAPLEALGWQYGTVEVQTPISATDVPKDLNGYKIKFHTDLGSTKMYPSKSEDGWKSKNQQSLKLPVRKRYSSCLAIEFRHHSMFSENTAAFAVFWLKDIPDMEEREITLTVWKGDFERAVKNAMPELGEKIGSITLKLTFWNGLGAAHSRWASKDQNVREVVEVLDTARDNYEMMENEEKAGIVVGNASDSSDSDSGDEGQADGSGERKGSLFDRAKDFKKHNQDLNKHNRGLMQWQIPRTAQWAKHKMEATEGKVTGLFKHHTRQPGIETEV